MEREPARVEHIGDLRARLRRAQGDIAPGARYGEEAPLPAVETPPTKTPEASVRIDVARRLVFVDGDRVDLPPKEFDLLAELVERSGRPIGAPELAKRAWPPDEHASVEDVHRHIYRLRRALGPRGTALIANRRGFGYVLEA